MLCVLLITALLQLGHVVLPVLEILLQPIGSGVAESGEQLHQCLVVRPGANCIKIGLPGKLILSKRKGLLEVLIP